MAEVPGGRALDTLNSLFKLSSEFAPAGDQPRAIERLVSLIGEGQPHTVLLGITGSGKTFTLANVIARLGRPALIMSPNKTLAAQLYSEFKSFFAENAAEYFVSYYDYYQPEAYIPQSDTYIEKDALVNDEIDRMRHSTTTSLFERRDVVVVASVSCIYGIGEPETYHGMHVALRGGQTMDRDALIRGLVAIQYERNDYDFRRGTFRVRGDVVEIFPAAAEAEALRVEFWGLEQRTLLDMEMLREIGYCHGIENYSRHLAGRKPGQNPATLMDYLPKDTLVIIDESHVTVPQIRGMYAGDRSRKEALVEYGFRLPSAFDNRPLTFEEFAALVPQTLYVSATPGPYELALAGGQRAGPGHPWEGGAVAEQIIRPTGLMDPKITVRAAGSQVDDLMAEVRARAERDERALITTLTKRMAEDLTEYYQQNGLRVRYLHSDIDTLERVALIRDLRLGKFDGLIGINLLREGLDLPEVSLVAILDADKEGYLRSATSLIQTAGRAARNVNGEVVMYADTVTGSMREAIAETERRRLVQAEYNRQHGITPESIKKSIRELLETVPERDYYTVEVPKQAEAQWESPAALAAHVAELERAMKEAAKRLDFERAAELRDRVKALRKIDLEVR